MGSGDSVNDFFNTLNDSDPNINFLYEKSQHSVNFIDTTVIIIIDSKLICTANPQTHTTTFLTLHHTPRNAKTASVSLNTDESAVHSQTLTDT